MELFAILTIADMESTGFQKPPKKTSALICLKGMVGVHSFVAKLEDLDEDDLKWEEVQKRLGSDQFIVELVEDESEIEPDKATPLTLWVNPELIPNKEPLQGLTIRDDNAVLTHIAASTDGVPPGKKAFRVVLHEPAEVAA